MDLPLLIEKLLLKKFKFRSSLLRAANIEKEPNKVLNYVVGRLEKNKNKEFLIQINNIKAEESNDFDVLLKFAKSFSDEK